MKLNVGFREQVGDSPEGVDEFACHHSRESHLGSPTSPSGFKTQGKRHSWRPIPADSHLPARACTRARASPRQSSVRAPPTCSCRLPPPPAEWKLQFQICAAAMAAVIVGASPIATMPVNGVFSACATIFAADSVGSWNFTGIARSPHGSSSTWQRSVASVISAPTRSAASRKAFAW